MKKYYFLVLFAFLCSGISIAQEEENDQDSTEEAEEEKSNWNMGGNFAILINQASFNSDWLGGGVSNYSANLVVSYDINYAKDRLSWDTKFLGDYGITQTKDQDFSRKTNDRLELNSVVGYKVKEDSKWSYSGMMNFRTQFAPGYIFGTDGEGNETRTLQTDFMSPAFLQFGLGALWKQSDNFRINISPATGRVIMANSRFTSFEGYQDGDFFGLDAGKSARYEFGAALTGYGKFTLMKNVTMENFFNLYANYLENFGNVDIDYTLNLVMKVNKYISTNFTMQAIYDDNAVRGFQIRQVLGVGVSFTL